MWKSLAIIAAVLTAGSAYFSYSNAQQFKTERQLLDIAQANVAKAQGRLKDAQANLTSQKAGLQKTLDERDAVQKEVDALKAKAEALVKQTDEKKTELEEVTTRWTAVRKQVDDVGGVSKLKEQLTALSQEKAALDEQVANLKQQTAIAIERTKQLGEAVTALKTKEAWQAQGIIEDGFRTRVREVDQTWGFVTIDAGNSRGVVSGATLDVKRGGSLIGQVKVTNVEQSFSIADVILGSVAEGDSIRRGDSVAVSAVSSAAGWRNSQKASSQASKPAAPAKPAAEAGQTPAPPADAPPAPADPFADPAAPAAPAADKPVEAPAADPFAN